MKTSLKVLVALASQVGAYALAMPGLTDLLGINHDMNAHNPRPTAGPVRVAEPDELSRMARYEQWAAAAYCEGNNDPTSTKKITCSAGNCPDVEKSGSESILEFMDLGLADATGFVAVDNTAKEIILAFRGSHSVKNYVSVLEIVMIPTLEICKGCWAHSGFYSSWVSSKLRATEAVAKAKAAHPDYKVIVTGHSLGGAIAALAAADIRQNNFACDLYTYGAPMVGNKEFCEYLSRNDRGSSYRVTHHKDLVPKLPGYDFFGYRHFSPEYWITSLNNSPVTKEDIKVSSGSKNLDGNTGVGGWSTEDHLWYFNAVSACAPKGLEIT